MSVILIVEDDEEVRVLAESVLRDAGYGALSATALEGAQALLNSDQLIDLMFVDVNLGGDLEAGLRIARNARERRPLLPIVYTTGQGVDDGKKALFAEPYLFLPKPYTFVLMQKNAAHSVCSLIGSPGWVRSRAWIWPAKTVQPASREILRFAER